VEVAESLFGPKIVADFLKEYRGFEVVSGYIVACMGKALSGRLIKECDRRKRISIKKLKKARVMLRYLRYIPWVKFAAVSGSVAFMSAEESDDIDVFLVTSRNRLWLTRAIELVLFRVLGVRRKYEDIDIRDKICINYYTVEDNLNLKENGAGDFFTALELVMMRPACKEEFWEVLMFRNSWIRGFFPGVKIIRNCEVKSKRVAGLSFLLDIINRILMKLQISYMKMLRHPYKESTLEIDEIRFFPSDGWEKRRKHLKEKLELYDLG